MITSIYASPLGALTLVSDGVALTGLYFENHKHGGAPAEAKPGHDKIVIRAKRALDAYFNTGARSFDLPLAPKGTPFQQRVWRALRDIPYGETISYGVLAQRMEAPAAVRAVGAAIGRNPLSIIVPCHRVLGADGSLTGFAGGVERKRALLALESAAGRAAAMNP